MGNILPASGISTQGNEFQNISAQNGAAVFGAFQRATIQPVKNKITMPPPSLQKDSVNLSKKEPVSEKEEKKGLPWKKIALGAIAATIFIEFNLRRNPRRKQMLKQYEEIFSNTTGTEIRSLSMIPYRDEVLIREAADGSKKANEIISEFDYDALGIVKYIQKQRKIEKARQYYLEGRFEVARTDTLSNKQLRRKFFRELGQLQAQADELYDRCIVPLLKNR